MTREIGSQCKTFAFPNGNYTDELARYAINCGPSTVMTTRPTWVESDCPLWRLPRIQLFPSSSVARVQQKLAAAALGVVLRNPDGTGRDYCKRRSVRRTPFAPAAALSELH